MFQLGTTLKGHFSFGIICGTDQGFRCNDAESETEGMDQRLSCQVTEDLTGHNIGFGSCSKRDEKSLKILVTFITLQKIISGLEKGDNSKTRSSIRSY